MRLMEDWVANNESISAAISDGKTTGQCRTKWFANIFNGGQPFVTDLEMKAICV